jgi:DNA invertase Pin-like site-specific DNA recombinase
MVKYYVYFIGGLKGRKTGARRKVIPEHKKIRIRFLKSCLYTEKEIAKELGIKTIFVKRVIEET